MQTHRVSLDFAGTRYPDVALQYGGAPIEGDGGGWMLEVPALLRILKAADGSAASFSDLRGVLLATIASFSKRSRCCLDCENGIDSYAAALQEYQKALEESQRREGMHSPETHPYVVSTSGKVHQWDCRSKPGLPLIEHPGQTLQEYVHSGRAINGYEPYLWTGEGATRMTAAELADWLNSRSEVQRCKLCQPALPGAYGSEASDVEATGRR